VDLSSKERRALALHMEGYSHAEIAKEIDRSVSYVPALIKIAEGKQECIELIQRHIRQGELFDAVKLDLEQEGLGRRGAALIGRFNGDIRALLAHTEKELEDMHIKGAGRRTIVAVDRYLTRFYALKLGMTPAEIREFDRKSGS